MNLRSPDETETIMHAGVITTLSLLQYNIPAGGFYRKLFESMVASVLDCDALMKWHSVMRTWR